MSRYTGENSTTGSTLGSEVHLPRLHFPKVRTTFSAEDPARSLPAMNTQVPESRRAKKTLAHTHIAVSAHQLVIPANQHIRCTHGVVVERVTDGGNTANDVRHEVAKIALKSKDRLDGSKLINLLEVEQICICVNKKREVSKMKCGHPGNFLSR